MFHGVHRRILLLLNLVGKSDDAAGDLFAFTLTEAAQTIRSFRVLNLIVVIFSLVNGHGATNDGVRSAQVYKEVSVFVLSVGIEAGLDLLNVADTALVNVLVRVSTVGAEGVKDASSGLTAVL